MADITLVRRALIDESNIGAIVCHTPKASYNENTHCELVRSLEQLEASFGDPYIDPTMYSDLIMVRNLVRNGIPVYVSSVKDTLDHNDGFTICSYNGYTEFLFTQDESDTSFDVKYRLKSNIKFCQPLISKIEISHTYHRLHLYVSLFYLDIGLKKTQENVHNLDRSRLYKVIHFVFNLGDSNSNDPNYNGNTDDDIINDFRLNGLELQIETSQDQERGIISFIDYLRGLNIKREESEESSESEESDNDGNNSSDDTLYFDYAIDVLLESSKESPSGEYDVECTQYNYNINTLDYKYDFDSFDDTCYCQFYNYNEDYKYDPPTDIRNLNTDRFDIDASHHSAKCCYYRAINILRELRPEPLMLCLGRTFKISYTDKYDTSTGNFIEEDCSISELDPSRQVIIFNFLMDRINEDSNTYLFINAPDLSVTSTLNLINQEREFSGAASISEHFNCDLFFGYATDFISSSLQSNISRKAYYSAALLSFVNLMLDNSAYLTNNFINLNIANRCVKLVISERSASKLMNAHCNSMVLFDIGSPSAYGDRSLSRSPNLQYSHISRNFVLIRRIINLYLETQKFIINTIYNIDTCISYVRHNVLDTFLTLGVIKDYYVDYRIADNVVYIRVMLIFNSIAEAIILNFTI